MYIFKRIAVLLSIAVLVGVSLNLARAPSAEAGDNVFTNPFVLGENLTFVDPQGTTGGGEIRFNTKNGTFLLKIHAENLVPGTVYRVTQTVRHSTSGLAPAVIILDVEVTADREGRIKYVTTKPIFLNIFTVGAVGDGPNWRIDQQLRLTGSGTKGGCVDCLLVCSPTTKINVVDGKLFEGWV